MLNHAPDILQKHIKNPLLISSLACITMLACSCDKEQEKASSSPAQEVGSSADAKKQADAKEDTTSKPGTTAKTPEDSSLVTTFDMVDNRHLAHLYDQGLTIDFGQGGALKYVQGRWKNPWFDTQLADDKHTFAYPSGPGATIRFPLGEPGDTNDGSWKIQAHLKPVGDQRCDIFIKSASDDKEEKFASIALEDGWKTYAIDIPKDIKPGNEISVRFHFSRSRDVPGVGASAAAFDWIRIGKNLSEEAPARLGAIFNTSEKSIALKPKQRVAWYTVPGKDAQFTVDASKAAKLLITKDNSPTETITIKQGKQSVDLSKWANTAVKLELAADKDAVTFSHPRLTTAKKDKVSGEKPQYVVVWLIDTLRADHLKAYNPKTDVETPNLDTFIKSAALFERAAVQGNSSLPSSASIFSGSYPPMHGVVKESARHQKDATLLGEGLKKQGLATGLFSSNGYVSEKWGFARGFDTEFNPIREGIPSDAENLWPKAKEWLEAQVKKDAKQPVLVYLNTSDPHVPYDPPQEQLAKYHSGGKVGKVSPRGTGELLHDMAKKGGPKLNAAETAYMRALYKGEITYNDIWFGKMLADLDALGIRDKTMIIVTSDHGEEFGEYGRFGHGVSVNQELVDVPLIIGYTPWTKNGKRIPDAVETLDIYPTLLDAFGQKSSSWDDNIQGQSLVPHMLEGHTRHPGVSFSYHNDFLRGSRVADVKYQLFQGDKDPLHMIQYHPTKYDNYLKATPIDGEDVANTNPVARRMMRDTMAFQVGFDDQGWRRHVDGAPNNHSDTRAKALDTSW